MPSQILHVLHGRAVLARFSSGMALLADRELEGFFCLGSQGPDIFYHNQRTRPLALEYGSLLHRRGYGSFTAAIAIGLESEGARGRAWLAGFLCHAVLDRALHPYIISRSGPGPGAGVEADGNSRARLHIFFERLLDVAMAEYLEEGRHVWDQAALLSAPARAALNWLPMPLAAALCSTFPARACNDEKLELRMKNALSDSAGFFEATDPERLDSSPITRHLLSPEALPRDLDRQLSLAALIHPQSAAVREQMNVLDLLNLGHNEWLHPCEDCAAASSSVPELFEDAVAAAAEALAALFRNEHTIGDAGLSLNSAEAKRCTPTRFSPLPVAMLLALHLKTLTDRR